LLTNRPIVTWSFAADVARHDRVVALVEQMLALHKRRAAARTPQEQDALQGQIDRLVYEASAIRIQEGITTVQRLFVYGTLAPGRPNEHVLAPLGGAWQPATVNGRLIQQGWGAAMGFPALVLDERGEAVSGLVFSAAKLGAFWDTLDAFEGEAYERVRAKARLEDGAIVEAYVYVLRTR
jgi:gamma-glutamylcyclotransferase (GGCT)/AIG2-like uncharacterized protein YtfP